VPANPISSDEAPSVATSVTEPASPITMSHGGGRAFGLGPRRAVLVAAAVLVSAILVMAFVGALLNHGSGSAAPHRLVAAHPSATTRPVGQVSVSAAARGSAVTHGSTAARSAKYGGLPSWLPKAKIPVGRVLQASSAHPVLAIQGDTVSVHLASRRVLVTAVGPTVPEEGRFPVPETTPCTFIITFTAATGPIPISATAFTFVDELHRVHHPRVTAMDGGALPRGIAPGRTVSLKVYDVLPTGDGGLEWAPEGARPIVAWDFDVEID
jgi:hypothetical protein